MSKNNHFTQTKIAQKFGLSSIKMGQKLVELNLKCQETKLPTDLALQQGFAIIVESPNYGSMGVWKTPVIGFLKQHLEYNKHIFFDSILATMQKIKNINMKFQNDEVHKLEAEIIYDELSDKMYSKYNSIKNNIKQKEAFCEYIIEKKKEKLLICLEADIQHDLNITLENVKLKKINKGNLEFSENKINLL